MQAMVGSWKVDYSKNKVLIRSKILRMLEKAMGMHSTPYPLAK